MKVIKRDGHMVDYCPQKIEDAILKANLEVEEDLSKLTNYYFSGNKKIDIGDEVYLFHANDGSSALSIDRLGFLSKEDLNRLLEENKMNIFIKLACEEIKK